MTNVNGLNDKEVNIFLVLLVKANDKQLNSMNTAIREEKIKRMETKFNNLEDKNEKTIQNK